MKDPQTLYLLFNVLLIVVIGLIGWLMKRAIASNDQKVDEAIKLIGEATLAVNKLQLLIVGDYYPRKEHAEYARHLEVTLEQLRENIHKLRDQMQTIVSKVSVMETITSTLKEERSRH